MARSGGAAADAPRLAADNWAAVIAALGVGGVARQLATHCTLQAVEGQTLRLQLSPGHQPLMAGGPRDKLEAALRAVYGDAVRLRIEVTGEQADSPANREAQRREQRQSAAVQAIENDPQVRALCDMFDTRVEADNVRPLAPGTPDDTGGR